MQRSESSRSPARARIINGAPEAGTTCTSDDSTARAGDLWRVVGEGGGSRASARRPHALSQIQNEEGIEKTRFERRRTTIGVAKNIDVDGEHHEDEKEEKGKKKNLRGTRGGGTCVEREEEATPTKEATAMRCGGAGT